MMFRSSALFTLSPMLRPLPSPRRAFALASASRNGAPSKVERSSSNPDLEELSALGQKLGIGQADYEKWYSVNEAEIKRNGGARLLKRYGSIASLVSTGFAEHEWDLSKFSPKHTRKNWKSIETERQGLLELGHKLGINEGQYEAWYKVSGTAIKEGGGGYLLKKHGGLPGLVAAAFPEHAWDRTKFVFKSKSYWENSETQAKFMTELRQKLGIREGDYEAWYKVTTTDIVRSGGRSLYGMTGNTLFGFLSAMFPEHKWQPWKLGFAHASKFWDHIEILKETAKRAEEALEFKSVDDWYRLSVDQVRSIGLRYVLKGPPEVLKFLELVYPDHKWDRLRFNFVVAKFPRLRVLLGELLGDHGGVLTSKDSPLVSLSRELSSYAKNLIVVPSWRVAFSYQGPRRFTKYLIDGISPLPIQNEVELKAALGLDVIPIPFWWDGQRDSLLAEILKFYPKLFDKGAVLESYKEETMRAHGILPRYYVTARARKDFLRSNTVFRGSSAFLGYESPNDES